MSWFGLNSSHFSMIMSFRELRDPPPHNACELRERFKEKTREKPRWMKRRCCWRPSVAPDSFIERYFNNDDFNRRCRGEKLTFKTEILFILQKERNWNKTMDCGIIIIWLTSKELKFWHSLHMLCYLEISHTGIFSSLNIVIIMFLFY